jgi:hypothetical protein
MFCSVKPQGLADSIRGLPIAECRRPDRFKMLKAFRAAQAPYLFFFSSLSFSFSAFSFSAARCLAVHGGTTPLTRA